jgi:hypothetical protein
MSRAALIAVATWLVACLPPPSREQPPAVTDAEPAPEPPPTIHMVAATAMVAAGCNGAPVGTAPAVHGVPVQGRFVSQPCGMLAVEIATPAFREHFAAERCAGALDEACERALFEEFWHRLGERYAYADWDRVLVRCQTYRDQCQPYDIESWALELHNLAIDAWARETLADQRASSAAINEAGARAALQQRMYRLERRQRFMMGAGN